MWQILKNNINLIGIAVFILLAGIITYQNYKIDTANVLIENQEETIKQQKDTILMLEKEKEAITSTLESNSNSKEEIKKETNEKKELIYEYKKNTQEWNDIAVPDAFKQLLNQRKYKDSNSSK